MKIVFVSNYFNHHQKPLSDALFSITFGDYAFVSTEEMSEERKKLGYGNWEIPEYVKYTYKTEQEKNECQKLIDEADVVIAGSAPRSLFETRLKNKKLTFYYSERPYKIKPTAYKYPIHFLKNIKPIIRHKNLYILCSSAYTSADYAKVFTFKNKAYKWGYFTAVKEYEDVDALIEKKTENSILWAARFINWKHPEHAVEVAKRLKADGYAFTLNMIGNGELEEQIRKLIEKENLSDCVRLLGSMKPEEVREHMEKSEIFLFTSDRNEGWGAVLNESMNSVCAVVANSAIGSVPFLMKDGENGYMYKDGDVDDLYNKVRKLLDNAEERKHFAKNAYKTMTDEWNAENAGQKFVKLCERMLDGEYKPFPFAEGVCSKAEELKDNWYKLKKER